MKSASSQPSPLSGLLAEVLSLNDSALAGDFEEARFLARRVATRADAWGYARVALAAARLCDVLGPPGYLGPIDGLGRALVDLTDELDRLH